MDEKVILKGENYIMYNNILYIVRNILMLKLI